ncbi:hypothetical protein [Vibrio phage vB_VhaP_PG11]|nr:hypothetical protein [Vibrio phage vB_VhaP_PG11]
MATIKTSTTRTSNSEERAPALAYINVGKFVKSNNPEAERDQYMLSPFYGIAIEEKPAKTRLSKQEKALYAAILAKVEAIREAGGEGQSHTINLDLEIFVPAAEAAAVEAGDFDL